MWKSMWLVFFFCFVFFQVVSISMCDYVRFFIPFFSSFFSHLSAFVSILCWPSCYYCYYYFHCFRQEFFPHVCFCFGGVVQFRKWTLGRVWFSRLFFFLSFPFSFGYLKIVSLMWGEKKNCSVFQVRRRVLCLSYPSSLCFDFLFFLISCDVSHFFFLLRVTLCWS